MVKYYPPVCHSTVGNAVLSVPKKRTVGDDGPYKKYPFRQGGQIGSLRRFLYQKKSAKKALFCRYLISSMPIYLRSTSGMVTLPSSF